MIGKETQSNPRKHGFRLNLIALLSILSLLILTYHVTEVRACQDGSYKQAPDGTQTPLLSNKHKPGKKNIIMMVTDGTGPSSFNMARSYYQYVNDLAYNDTLTIDKYLLGQSRTRSSSSLITDSAAGATAFSCGLKSYNGAIAVDDFHDPCMTILESLKLKGYKTGLVVTTSITDATPAAYSAHVDFRSMQDEIASQQLGINSTFFKGGDGQYIVDLMIGGGRCSFLPKSDVNGCRSDEVNLIEYAESKGYHVALNKEEFDRLELGLNREIRLPILSLLAYYNLPYEIDRSESKFPSLYEETVTSLNMLSRETEDSDQGFFLMIEGSRIDHAGHHNDPHAQVREILAYDRAFQEVIKFAQESEVETYVVSTSDHETGGIDIGRQITNDYPDYIWYPEVLQNAKHSGEYLNFKINRFLGGDYCGSGAAGSSEGKKNCKEVVYKFFIDEVLEKDLGIVDYATEEVDNILRLAYNKKASGAPEMEIREVDAASEVVEYLKDMVSRRARIGWSTHGHTAADVNIYGYCNREEGMQRMRSVLGGSVENTDIFHFLNSLQ